MAITNGVCLSFACAHREYISSFDKVLASNSTITGVANRSSCSFSTLMICVFPSPGFPVKTISFPLFAALLLQHHPVWSSNGYRKADLHPHDLHMHSFLYKVSDKLQANFFVIIRWHLLHLPELLKFPFFVVTNLIAHQKSSFIEISNSLVDRQKIESAF